MQRTEPLKNVIKRANAAEALMKLSREKLNELIRLELQLYRNLNNFSKAQNKKK